MKRASDKVLERSAKIYVSFHQLTSFGGSRLFVRW